MRAQVYRHVVECPALTASRRRAALTANTDTCDLYVSSADQLLRILNPKAGGLRCVQLIRPQLLHHAFLRNCPSFWHEPPHVQAQLVQDASLGTEGMLDIPHEVVELRLNQVSGLVALVGVHRISVLVLPPPQSVANPLETANELGRLLAHLGLEEYGEAMRREGYDSINELQRMTAAERERMIGSVGLRPGHAQTLSMHLDGRLPTPSTSSAADPAGEPVSCWALPVPLSPVSDASITERPVAGSAAVGGATSAFWAHSKARDRGPPAAAGSNSTNLEVVQAEWHPLGENHLGVLLSNGMFHLFDAATNMETPALSLQMPLDQHGAAEAPVPCGFSFGPAGHGWSSLSVVFASSDGAVFVACPLVPCGDRARRHVRSQIQTLSQAVEGNAVCETSLEWLRRFAESDKLLPQPASQSPAMQGPLNMTTDIGLDMRSAITSSPEARTASGAFQLDTPIIKDPPFPSTRSRVLAICCQSLGTESLAILLGRADGTIAIGLLEGIVTPKWVHPTSVPQSPAATGMNALTTPGGNLLGRGGALGSGESTLRGCVPVLPSRRTRPRTPSRAARSAPDSVQARPDVDTCAEEARSSLSLLQLSMVDLRSATRAPLDLRWMKLTADSVERIFAHTSAGTLHVIQLPWLSEWGRFLHSSSAAPAVPRTPPAESCALALIQRDSALVSDGVVGVHALRDPSLGDALFVLQSDGTCSRLQLERIIDAQLPDATKLETGDQAEAHFEMALKSLAHHRQSGQRSGLQSDILWEQSKSELQTCTPQDTMSAFGRALAALTGQDSTLQYWGALVEETKSRLERIQKQSAMQPKQEQKLSQDVAKVAANLHMLQHKAQFAEAMQHNLERRSRALRTVLRSPTLWPSGEISEDERRQHRQLLAVRDRVLDGRRALQELVLEAEASVETGSMLEDEAASSHTTTKLDPARLFPLQGVDALGSGDISGEEESLELKRQDELLQKLCNTLKEAKEAGDEALALAQRSVGTA